MAAMDAANTQYQNGHQQQQGPSLPASPTLTNPDMILPDYPRSDSPDPDLGHSSLMMWKDTTASMSSSDLHNMFVATGMGMQRHDYPYGPTGPITPTTPIIYGNGTMLSDIGEVTEVESTVGKSSPPYKSTVRRPDSPAPAGGKAVGLRSSPVIKPAAMIKKKSRQNLKVKRERRASLESNSTITTEDRPALFADFDDTVSVGDSVFQGDDEESMASSYVEGTEAVEPARPAAAKVDNVDRMSTYSTTSLSRRAEEILANAKKRLTTMEGNLTRARSTLHYSSPYGSDGSTPSPGSLRGLAVTYSRHNVAESDVQSPNHPYGHTRMSSDVAMQNGLGYRASLPRSQSALGAAGGYRQPLAASKSDGHMRKEVDEGPGRFAYKSSRVPGTGYKPLTEEEVARLGEADSASQNARLEAFLSPTASTVNDNNVKLQRSPSAAQMRDIKDQMRDLKGKISSLREQARADSLKRRSLQSLRTPSPFTHAQIDHWYAEPRSNRTSQITVGGLPEKNPWNGEESSVDGDSRENARYILDENREEDEAYAEVEHGTEPGQDGIHEPDAEVEDEFADDVSDKVTENGDVDDESEDDFHDAEDADYMSESGESLYHDTVQHQISHEDREDAFDYEHFFLHSAMGTMSHLLNRRRSNESFTSEDSVETTKGPVAEGPSGDDYNRDPNPSRTRVRRNSGVSVSTIETFATAQERGSMKSPVSHDEAHSSSDATFESLSRATSAQSTRYRSGSTATTKRHSVIGPVSSRPPTSTNTTRDSDGSVSPIAEEGSQPSTHHTARRGSVIHRPISASPSTLLHRPSVSSFESRGTNRSFPLVNRPSSTRPPKAHSTGFLTPRDSPDHDELRTISSKLMSDTLYACARHGQTDSNGNDNNDNDDEDKNKNNSDDNTNHPGSAAAPDPLSALLREDRYLVERVVASLGRCVLGLTENGRASAESRMFRRRIDAARRVLEGVGEGVE
ncbi:hypothetical protein VTK26DRAFT_1907 [Humicola hyalothermophila]